MGVLTNYFDRIALPVSAPKLLHDMTLNAGQIGIPLSAAARSCGGLQLPISLVLDRFGVRWRRSCNMFVLGQTKPVPKFAARRVHAAAEIQTGADR